MIDTTEKRRTAARDLITQSDLLMRSVNALRELSETVASAGLVFEDEDFAGQPGLEHVNADIINNVLNNAVALHNHASSHKANPLPFRLVGGFVGAGGRTRTYNTPTKVGAIPLGDSRHRGSYRRIVPAFVVDKQREHNRQETTLHGRR